MALAVVLLSTAAQGAPPEYQNYFLPKIKNRAVLPDSRLTYKTPRFAVEGSKARLKKPGISHEEFLFAREAFVTERRDQAIKLLRQEIDAGYKVNLANRLLQLGQLYAEKYMELSYHENSVHSQKIREWEAKPANKRGKAPKFDSGRSRKYLRDALTTFYSLERKYPRHPKMDEVLFFIGFVEMESGNGKKGARYLERVIRGYPRSRKYDEAVTYLGDHYFERQQFKTAAAKYSILLKRRDARLRDYALYKIAWCHLNMGQQRRGLEEMKTLINRLEGKDGDAQFNLRRQALQDIVVFYGEIGAVQEAYAFFRDKMDSKEALKNLRLLGDLLRSKARDQDAIEAYELFLKEDPENLEAPAIQLAVYESLARLGYTARAVQHLKQAILRYGESSDFAEDYPKDRRDELKSMLADLQKEGFNVAKFHHRAGQKGRNKVHYTYALELYDAMLKGFPKHPEKKTILFYIGEVLYEKKNWLKASEAYLLSSKIPPKDKLTDEAVYNALLALDQLTQKRDKIKRYSAEEMKKNDFSEKSIPEGEKRFIDVAEYYMKEYPKGVRIADVRFRIASIYYAHNHLDKALEGFLFVATQYPKHRSAKTSAYLVLDIYNIKREWEKLDDVSRRFAEVKGLGDANFRKEMMQLRDEIRFKKIEKLERDNKWTKAGESYLEVYRTNPKGKLAEQSLYNAVVSYEKSKDYQKSEEITRLFIGKFPGSPHAERLTLKLAKDAERRYDFNEARSFYDQFHQRFPRSKEARKALYNSAVFSELLGRRREALGLYEKYLKSGPISEDERKAIYISQGKLYRQSGNWPEFDRMYRRLIARSRSVSEKMTYLGELGVQYEKAGRTGDKKRVMQEILWLYKNSKSSQVSGPALRFAAEAMFEEAMKKRSAFDKYRLRFPPSDLIYLMKLKQRRLKELAKALDEVVQVGVPEWGVAAIYEKSDAYLAFVNQYRGLSIPAKYNEAQRKETEAGLKQIDGEVVTPLEKEAREFLAACVEKSREFYVANRYSRQCHEQYARANKEVVVPSGLIPRPGYWSTRPLAAEVVLK